MQQQRRPWWRSEFVQILVVFVVGALVLYAFRGFVVAVLAYLIVIAAMVAIIIFMLTGRIPGRRRRG